MWLLVSVYQAFVSDHTNITKNDQPGCELKVKKISLFAHNRIVARYLIIYRSPALNRLCDVDRCDIAGRVQIGNGTGDLEDSGVTSGSEV